MSGTSDPGPAVKVATGSAAEGDRGLAIASPENHQPNRVAYWPALASAIMGLAIGGGVLFTNTLDHLTVPALLLLAVGAGTAVLAGRRFGGPRDRGLIVLTVACVATAGVLAVLPEWLYGWQINGIIHRSALSAPAMLGLSVLVASRAIRGLAGDTPTGRDLALYPLLGLPIALAFIAYGLVLGRVILDGMGQMRLDLLTTTWQQHLVDANGAASFAYDIGLRNNILGTLELIALTSLIAILPGVGAGVFMSEYPGPLARLVDLCTTMLRAVSVLVLGAAAFVLVTTVGQQAGDSLISVLVRGTAQDQNGLTHPGTGSFLTASVFLALLVIPVIAKLTEEGLRSVPREIREGSIALGATEGYGLRRILLPWASLNIVTALLLGAAEASGSLAVILFIAGTGQDGVTPTTSVTSLDFALFATTYGPKPYVETMRDLRSATALLLIVLTLGLTAAAIVLRRRIARRYRGTLTGQ